MKEKHIILNKISLVVFACACISIFPLRTFCQLQVRITDDEVINEYKAQIMSLAVTEDGSEVKKFLIRSIPNSYPKNPDGSGPTGFKFTLTDEGVCYVYEYASDVQAAKSIKTAFVTRIIALDDRGVNSKAVCSYYKPYDNLVWERSYDVGEGIMNSQVHLSPLGYVVEYSRFTGELLFINDKGEVYNKYVLYDADSLSFDKISRSLPTANVVYKNAMIPNFSQDGKTFAFVLGRVVDDQSCTLFVFNNSGELLFKGKTPQNSPDKLAVSPKGDRIFLGVHGIRKGKYRDTVPGISAAECYLYDRTGKILKEVDGFCKEVLPSETGRFILVNIGKSAFVLRLDDGSEMFRYRETSHRKIVGLAINELREMVCLIIGSGFGKNKDRGLDFKFITFYGHIVGELSLSINEHKVFGSAARYSLMFNKEGNRFAFGTEGKVFFGVIE